MSNSIQDHIAGTNYKFEIGGVEYEMRPPTPGERDKAELIEARTGRYLRMTDDEIKELAKLPPPEEEIAYYEALIDIELQRIKASDEDNLDLELIERNMQAMKANIRLRTAATSIVNVAAAQKRNRYLAKTLLVDNDYSELHPGIQDELTNKASEIWSDLSEIPFLSEQQ